MTKWLFISSIFTWLLTSWFQDQLPAPDFYAGMKLAAPEQSDTSTTPFEISTDQQRYKITPVHSYKLTGVVVSYSNADGFTNIWHHRRWQDFINLRDLCVIWDPNVENGVYQQIKFSSDSWTCWASWSDSTVNDRFNFTALSNNHLLAQDPTVKEALLSAHIGDVVSFRGMLVNYENLNNGYKRGTSTSRTDRGQGACETVFLNDFTVLKEAHPTLRAFNTISFWGIWLCLVALLYFAFTVPYKTKNH